MGWGQAYLGGRVVLNDSNEFEFIRQRHYAQVLMNQMHMYLPRRMRDQMPACNHWTQAALCQMQPQPQVMEASALNMSVVSLDASTAMLDTGSPTSDASSAAEDASMMSADANATPIDATPRLDAGEAAADLSLPGTDASATPPDANMP